MKNYNKEDLIHVLKGASFLSGGGGGAYVQGSKLIDYLEQSGYDIEFELYSVEEMEDCECAFMVAMPKTTKDMNLDRMKDNLLAVYTELNNVCGPENRNLKYIYSGEMGGFSTMLPIFLSIIANGILGKKIGVVDVDVNGSSVPSLSNYLTAARGIMPSPFATAGYKVNEGQTKTLIWPKKISEAENVLRSMEDEGDSEVVFATWPMLKEELENNGGINYISYSKRIGEALENIGMPMYDALHSVIPHLKELHNGFIQKIILSDPEDGSRGAILIGNDENKMESLCILFQKGSLVVGKYVNRGLTDIYLTAPEVISMVDSEKRIPITYDMLADLEFGQKVTIFVSPAHHYWWDNKNAHECFRAVLQNNGYFGEFVRFSSMFEDNRVCMKEIGGMNLQLAYVGNNDHMQDFLRDYMQQNLYNDGVAYKERILCQNYHSEDDLTAKDPTVTEQDIVRNGPDLLQLSKERYIGDTYSNHQWDGHFVSRFGDEKTIRALREATSRPIFDAFESTMYLSLCIADKIGVVTWPGTMVPILERRIAGAALNKRILWVKAAKSHEMEDLKIVAKELIQCGAQALILGRSFWSDEDVDYSLAENLQKLLNHDVPVIDVNKVGIRWLEMITHMGYFHSRLSYYIPPAKNI